MKTKTLTAYKLRLQRVLSYIGTHLDSPLSLEDLAVRACFSPYHFHRVFTGMMGEPLKEYVRRLRLERAAIQLAAQKGEILNVALDAGYESHEAFTRAFKAAFGLSPRAFRDGGYAVVPAPSGVHYEKDGAVKHFRTTKGSIMNVTVKHLEPMRVAYVAHVGPYDQVGKAWMALGAALSALGLAEQKGLRFGLAYDDPEVTDPAKIRYDACVQVAENFVPGEGLAVKTLDGADYATAIHKGPYEDVGKVYAAIYGQWLPRSGYDMRDAPTLEVYLNDPRITAAHALLTEVYAPIVKAT